jgi:hypothetical protein
LKLQRWSIVWEYSIIVDQENRESGKQGITEIIKKKSDKRELVASKKVLITQLPNYPITQLPNYPITQLPNYPITNN